MRLQFIIYFIVGCFFESTLNGQSFETRFEYLSDDQGLPQNHVFSVSQDSDGFIWFCTMGGLAKYDGFQFTNFTFDEQDSTTVSASYIDQILEDSKHRFWVGTLNGFNQMDRKTGKFKRYLHNDNDANSLGHNKTKGLAERKDGKIWIVHNDGIDCFDPQTEKFVHYLHDDFEISRHSGHVFIDRKNRIWVIGTKGVFWVNESRQSLEYIGQPAVKSEIPLEGRKFYEDSQGNLWVGFNRCLSLFDTESRSFTLPPIGKNGLDVSQVLEYPKGTLAIGTHGDGLIMYSLIERKIIQQYNYSPSDPGGISGSSIYSMYVDKQNNLWLGLFYGVNKINPGSDRFPLMTHAPGIHNLANYSLLLHQDNYGGIWNNTMKGLFYIKDSSSPYISMLSPPQFSQGFNNLKPIFSDNQKLYFSILNKGIFAYSFSKKTIEAMAPDKNLGELVVQKIEIHPKKPTALFMGCVQGLCKLDLLSGDTTWLRPKRMDQRLSGNYVGRFYSPDGNQFYFINTEKLFVYDWDKKTMRSVSSPYPIKGTIFNIKKNNNQLWIASTYQIYIYNINNNTWKNVVRKDDGSRLPSAGLEIDKQGYIWSITDSEISRIDPNGKVTHHYHSPTGFTNGNNAQGRDGTLFFGGNEGGVIFHPERYFKDTIAPKIIFTGLEIANKAEDLGIQNEYVSTFRLKHNQKTFSLNYAALHFINREAIRYHYRLMGFDKDWIYGGSKRRVTYTNLSPGTYTFEAIATTEDGISSKMPLKITIIIEAPFHRTWAFYTLIAFLIALLSYLFYDIRKKAAEAEKKRELAEQNANYKSMFMANMSHEIRTPMNAIVGLNQLLMDTPLTPKQMEYVKAINISCENMLWIINDILDQAKIESGKYTIVHKDFNLMQMLEQIRTLFAARAGEKDLVFDLTIDNDVPLLLKGDQVRLFQILANLLGNAIKFTNQGKVNLQVGIYQTFSNGCELRFDVRDTGIGIPREKLEEIFDSFSQIQELENTGNQGTGLGLSIVKKLCSLLGGKISVESTHGQGSNFTLILPFEFASQHNIIQEGKTKAKTMYGLHILLVEDAPLNQLVASELLYKHFEGLNLDIVSNGEEALKKCSTTRYDVVLMDVKMPVMDGLEATRQLRKMGYSYPILGLTANAIPQQLEECKKAGMDESTTKPIKIGELVEKIQALVNRD